MAQHAVNHRADVFGNHIAATVEKGGGLGSQGHTDTTTGRHSVGDQWFGIFQAIMLGRAGGKHDVVGIKVYDKMDRSLPAMGLLRVHDAETGEEKWVDSNSELVRYDYEKEFFRVTDYANYMFRKSGCSLLHLRTDEDYVKVLQKFFISRNR